MGDWLCLGKELERLAIGDRGFQYGDGLFETIAIRDGEPRLWHYHVERLTKGCRQLGIQMPPENELFEGVKQALADSDHPLTHATVKIIVSAGGGQRGYGRTFVDSPTVLLRAFPCAPCAIESYRDGIDTLVCATRLATGSATAGLKTLNRLEQVLARSEFAQADAFEGLTLDAEDNIICGTMSNVFFVNDNSISTPPLDQCGVEGVMRRHVIATLTQKSVSVSVRPFSLSQLEKADEVFLSNSQFGVLPVKCCEDMRWAVGDVTRSVMAILADNSVPECEL